MYLCVCVCMWLFWHTHTHTHTHNHTQMGPTAGTGVRTFTHRLRANFSQRVQGVCACVVSVCFMCVWSVCWVSLSLFCIFYRLVLGSKTKNVSTHLLSERKPSHAYTLAVHQPSLIRDTPLPPPSLLSAAGDVDANSVTYVNNIIKNNFLVQVETWTPAPSLVGAMRTFFIGWVF